MKYSPKKITTFLLLFVLAQIVHSSKENKKAQKSYSSSTSFSSLLTSGNTSNRSLGLDTEKNWKSTKNHFQFKGGIMYAESEGSKETEFYYSYFQTRVELKSKAYILGFGKLERNILSGYNYMLALTLGADYFWTKSEKFVLSSEAALGWSLENNIEKATGIQNLAIIDS
jgi:putative salt-induced outer membrane protein YdiY